MKKRIILKNWVKNLLLGILCITAIVGAMDFESTKIFIIVHLIDATIMLICFMLLWLFTDLIN